MLRTAVVAALFLVVAACTATGDPGGTPSVATSGSAVMPSVTVVRTGGIAGVNDTFIVNPDGSWTVTDKAGTTKSGKLNAQQAHELQRLATEPAFAAESRQQRGQTKCADAFAYKVTVTGDAGPVLVSFSDCPSDENLPQTAMAISVLVTGAASN
ncbi:protealysin inhibitor emfourin [Catellatospora bangladeshensis]|uniref:protealysin inhibitor emfourin n=1 Tax=Catellatospora bangladeshensis TaxID=310355 RepID=UPI00360CE199